MPASESENLILLKNDDWLYLADLWNQSPQRVESFIKFLPALAFWYKVFRCTVPCCKLWSGFATLLELPTAVWWFCLPVSFHIQLKIICQTIIQRQTQTSRSVCILQVQLWNPTCRTSCCLIKLCCRYRNGCQGFGSHRLKFIPFWHCLWFDILWRYMQHVVWCTSSKWCKNALRILHTNPIWELLKHEKGIHWLWGHQPWLGFLSREVQVVVTTCLCHCRQMRLPNGCVVFI